MTIASSIVLMLPVVAAQELELQAWQTEVLAEHNVYRCMHGLSALKWSSGIESNAQTWADHLAGNYYGASSHSSQSSRSNIGGFSSVGENIAWGNQPTSSVAAWYEEIKYTDGGKASSFSSQAGHYTQVVWKSTTTLGCGWFTGSKTDYSGDPPNYGNNLVCEYGPPGNYQGQFAQNVNGPVKSRSQCTGGDPAPSPSGPSPSPSGCKDSPSNWASNEGDSCSTYSSRSWCTSNGQEGNNWKSKWGSITDYADSKGVSALDACCECGGGSASGHLETNFTIV